MVNETENFIQEVAEFSNDSVMPQDHTEPHPLSDNIPFEITNEKPMHTACHWRIDEPNGKTSHGFCIECGAEREFQNWPTIIDRDTYSERMGMRNESDY